MHDRDYKIETKNNRFRAVCRRGYATGYFKRRNDAIDSIRVHQERRRLIDQREQV